MDIQRIGRYDIKSLIGQGGMSAVYLGYDPRSQREVAIKILPPYYLHAPKFRERFEREALMIALLEHPAIVPVYDMGEEDGQPYIVMRYMSGGSLSDKLKKGSIPLRECMEMYLRLAPALDTAHARGVIHRDVKPDNLLFDKYDNVFLSDFGLARLRETIGFANISDGSIMGTPAYMSPEQIQGDRELDGRSDIYSMGVVLYQMLCGSVPFSGTTAASVMMMHLVNPVPQIYELNKTLPTAVQAVLEKALAKHPNDRYETAAEFARAIQAVTTGVQRTPSPLRTEDNVPRRMARRSTIAISPLESASSNGGKSPSHEPSTNGNKTPLPSESPVPSARTEKPEPFPQPITAKKPRLVIPWWGLLVGFIVVILVSLALILRTLNVFPFSYLSNSNNAPENSLVQNSPSPLASVSSNQVSVVPGNADKLAFIKSSDIWTSNLDGSDLSQLTNDETQKSNLHWSPDGQSILYTSANCLKLVGLLTRQVLTLTCLTGVAAITAFDISPNGQQVAIGLPQSELYLLPYHQLFNLRQDSLPSDLPALAQCSDYAPYTTADALKEINWSLDDQRIALVLTTQVNGVASDEVSIFDFDHCTTTPILVKDISPGYFLFTLRGYFDHPEISSLSWNGKDQLLLNGFVNDLGFGDLQLYDLSQDRSQVLAPNGACCYRDAHYSPDGSYLFYSYQPEGGGDPSLYYTPSDELAKPGASLAAMVLPEGFLTGNLESLQPALRAVH